MKSFVYIEPSEEGVDSGAKQIASRMRKISADFRGPLVGISIGDHLNGKEEELDGLIDELIQIEVPSNSASNMEMTSKILSDVMRENGPGLLFLGFTHRGMELGPAVGWSLRVPVITNCVGIDWTADQLALRRPIQGSKLLISLAISDLGKGAVISVQKGAWKGEEGAAEGGHPVSLKYLPWRESWAAERTEVLGITEESLEGAEDITKADILVSVGRGLGDPENLPVMRDLAEKLGGMISCSRPVVDLGWLPASRQVGISGRTVSPVVYLALGISGQSNHLAGMDASGIVVAVNKDPSAPIFSVAHYGVVDNILEFVPALLEQIKGREASSP